MADKKIIDLERLQQFLSKCDARYIRFGKKVYDGTLGAGTSDLAGNLEPYSDDSGAEQSNPFISQGTGTDNNTAIVTTGNFAQLREKQGNTLVVAQIAPAISNFAAGTNSTLSVSDGVATLTKTTSTGNMLMGVPSSYVQNGHTYFIRFTGNKSNSKSYYVNIGNSVIDTLAAAAGKNLVATVLTATQTNVGYPKIGLAGAEVDDSVEFSDVTFFDITSWPADVIADLTAHPDHFFWYYNGPLAYNAGSLENANGVKLVCTHRNLFDGSKALLNKAMNTDGSTYTANGYLTSPLIPVVPNKPIILKSTTYNSNGAGFALFDANENNIGYIQWVAWDGTSYPISGYVLNIPSNVWFVKFFLRYRNGAISKYDDDIDLSLYYTTAEGGEGYEQHYEYKAPTVVDTGSEELLAFDTKDPDGTLHHNTGNNTNLGALEWTKEGNHFYSSVVSDLKIPFNSSTLPNLICPKYKRATSTEVYGETVDKSIGITTNGRFYVYDSSISDASSLVTALTNVPCQYELADSSKTTEEGTPFPENVEIDDYGMMYWLDANNNLVGIPQGAKFFYPFNYAGTLDDLYHMVNGDVNDLVTQSELSVVDDKHDALYEIIQANVGGALRHQLVAQVTAGGGTLDFANTAYLDLGSLSWTKTSQNRFYAGTAGSIKAPSSDSQKANILCSVFKTLDAGNIYGNTEPNVIGVNSSGVTYLYVDATYYANHTADQLKADLKGVLLAYEKAE